MTRLPTPVSTQDREDTDPNLMLLPPFSINLLPGDPIPSPPKAGSGSRDLRHLPSAGSNTSAASQPSAPPSLKALNIPSDPSARRTVSNNVSTNASACSSATAAVAAGLSGPFAAASGPLFSALLAPTQASGGDEVLSASRHPRLYIVLISLHGLVRGENMELGKDPDTGGQVGLHCKNTLQQPQVWVHQPDRASTQWPQ